MRRSKGDEATFFYAKFVAKMSPFDWPQFGVHVLAIIDFSLVRFDDFGQSAFSTRSRLVRTEFETLLIMNSVYWQCESLEDC